MDLTFLPLPLSPFQHLFALDDAALGAQGVVRVVADAPRSAPCRVSLIDADPGERLVLVNHVHLDVPLSPYRAGGPVFVREAALEAAPNASPPPILRHRLLSMRLYDAAAMMLDAEVIDGADTESWLADAFADPRARQAHIHTARRGCYLTRAVRTGDLSFPGQGC